MLTIKFYLFLEKVLTIVLIFFSNRNMNSATVEFYRNFAGYGRFGKQQRLNE